MADHLRTTPDETYIGDGLYVCVDQGMIRVRTPREHGDHVIYFERREIDNFLDWIAQINGGIIRQAFERYVMNKEGQETD